MGNDVTLHRYDSRGRGAGENHDCRANAIETHLPNVLFAILISYSFINNFAYLKSWN